MKIWFECTGGFGIEQTFLEWGDAMQRQLGQGDEFLYAVSKQNVANGMRGYGSTVHPKPAVEYEPGGLAAALMDAQPDVIHCHGMRQLQPLLKVRYPSGKAPQIVITMHSFRHGTPWRPVAAAVDGLIFRKHSETVTPHFLSTRSLDEFYRWLPILPKLARCVVFPLGVREPAAKNGHSGGELDGFLKELSALEIPRVVYLAEMRPEKRHVHLVEELAPLLRNRECVLVLCGDGPEAGRVRQTSERLGVTAQVKMTGHIPRERIWDVLCACNVGVCSSRSENSPRCVVEPLSAGLPVVTTDVGSAAMYVRDFVNGFVVPQCAIRGTLGKKVAALIRDRELREQMTRAARSSVLPEYSWWECARKTVCMYRAALASQT
jgi:glycosyltransferase involved in cell wall biosynthesis